MYLYYPNNISKIHYEIYLKLIIDSSDNSSNYDVNSHYEGIINLLVNSNYREKLIQAGEYIFNKIMTSYEKNYHLFSLIMTKLNSTSFINKNFFDDIKTKLTELNFEENKKKDYFSYMLKISGLNMLNLSKSI